MNHPATPAPREHLPLKKFSCIPHVDRADELLDIAFHRASISADKKRGTGFSRDRMARSREIEKVRITAIKDILNARLERIFCSFPDIRSMTPFYRELSRALIDVEHFKRSLGAIRWAQQKIGQFWALYHSKITKTQEIRSINPYRREYYGRIASVLKQIKANLVFLEDCRKTFKGFPVIDETLPTIAIVGFPNVGKTTLLFKITGSKPEIAPYAFTTKNINVSTFADRGKTVQVLDTPGTLNRFEKMNAIEKQAHLATTYIAKVLVYVFDPQESYPVTDQEQLHHDLRGIGKPMLVYISKGDITPESTIQSFREKYDGMSDAKLLKERMVKALEAHTPKKPSPRGIQIPAPQSRSIGRSKITIEDL